MQWDALCVSLPWGAAGQERGWRGRSLSCSGEQQGAGGEISTEQAAESTQVLWPVSSLLMSGSWSMSPVLQHRCRPTDTGQIGDRVARDRVTHSSSSDGSSNKRATKHSPCLIMYTFLPRL